MNAAIRRLALLVETIELECDPCEGICHGHDVTDDNRCALATDLASILDSLSGRAPDRDSAGVWAEERE
jgi:hypothetical protein